LCARRSKFVGALLRRPLGRLGYLWCLRQQILLQLNQTTKAAIYPVKKEGRKEVKESKGNGSGDSDAAEDASGDCIRAVHKVTIYPLRTVY
jgi:hypothetical protein